MKNSKTNKIKLNKETLTDLYKINGGRKCSIVVLDTVGNCQLKKDERETIIKNTSKNCNKDRR